MKNQRDEAESNGTEAEAVETERVPGAEYLDKVEEVAGQLREIVTVWNAPFRERVLRFLLDEVTPVTNAAGKLDAMQEWVREICESLPAESRCIIGMLERISRVDDFSCGAQWSTDILFSFKDPDRLEQLCQELGDSQLVKKMRAPYDLAMLICNTEERVREARAELSVEDDQRQAPAEKAAGASEEPTENTTSDLGVIQEILASWPAERVSFLREKLEDLPEALEQADTEKAVDEGTREKAAAVLSRLTGQEAVEAFTTSAEDGADDDADDSDDDADVDDGDDDAEELSTGLSALDALLDNSLNESLAASLVCMNMARKDKALSDKLIEALKDRLSEFAEYDTPAGLDVESEVVPVARWLRFGEGFEAGLASAGGDIASNVGLS